MNKSRIITFLVFVMLLSFALLVGGTMPYFLLYFFLLIFIIPLIHILINLIFLKGFVSLPKESLFSGETITIDYEVTNNSLLPLTYLEIQSNITKSLTGIDSPNLILSLGKKESFNKTETLTLKRRGFYELGEIEVHIRDVFGIFHLKKKISSDASLLVYPEIINLSTFQAASTHQLGELLVADSSFQDKNRVSTIREYKEGDRVQSIHWKLSAKSEMPIVKEFENRGDTHISIFIDNYKEIFKQDVDRRIEDKVVEAALSIVNYSLNHTIQVELITQNNKSHLHLEGEQVSHIKPFLEALARFKGDGALDFKSFITPKFDSIKRGSTVVIITPNLDAKIGAIGISLMMKNLSPLFIGITDIKNRTGYIDQEIENRLKQEGIPVYILDYNTDIKELLEVHYG